MFALSYGGVSVGRKVGTDYTVGRLFSPGFGRYFSARH